MSGFTIFSGTANPNLAESIARHLGVKIGACQVERFPDGELTVRLDEPIRRKEVFIVQPTSPPVNDHLVELLAFGDACHRAAASRVTAIIPYFGYARGDKRHGRREPVTASMVARLLEAVGIDHVVTIDPHAPQIEGFFQTPVDSLTAVPALCDAIRDYLPEGAVVVSPDAGRISMASEYAQMLGAELVVLHKRREGGAKTRVTHVVGDVRGRACLIIDDMISTGGTIKESVEALVNAGSRPEMIIAATHGLLVAAARENLGRGRVRELFVTDTVAAREWDGPEIKVVSVAPIIARAINQFMSDRAMSRAH